MYTVYFERHEKINYRISQCLTVDDRDAKILSNVSIVKADCSELDRIWNTFRDSIPFAIGCCSMTWYGDIAKCIHTAMVSGDTFGFH